MHSYWVRFKDGKKGCIQADGREAAYIEAESLGEVVSFQPLPYPASPRIGNNNDGCPSFCYDPDRCAGNTCCHKSYSCTE
ncbi:hypothetical protein SXHG_00016 [Synechococcus phage MRHenn-2013a]|nr:hypothetical protein SXHG_00016 [Synechococcus phage MRHenn-2013a]